MNQDAAIESINYSELQKSTPVLASRAQRCVAALIDLISVPILGFVLMLISGVLEHAEDFTNFWGIVGRIVALTCCAYLLLQGPLLFFRQQTFGKLWVGLKIISRHRDQTVNFFQLISVRCVFFLLQYGVLLKLPALIVLLDIGFIFTKNRQCLHDRLTNTIVVQSHFT